MSNKILVKILRGPLNIPSLEKVVLNHFQDAYREKYPDPKAEPGITWSPIFDKAENGDDTVEPHDRIDLMFYKGSKLQLMSIGTYHGNEPIETKNPPRNYRKNDWPSDHNAVVADFKIASSA